jgi:hypothetical protein
VEPPIGSLLGAAIQHALESSNTRPGRGGRRSRLTASQEGTGRGTTPAASSTDSDQMDHTSPA